MSKQRPRQIIVWTIGILLMAISIAIPPWRDKFNPATDIGKTDWLGFGPLWNPPHEYFSGWGVRINWPVLLFELLFIAGICWFLSGPFEDKPKAT